MKKIVLLVALCLCVGNLFAQDADKLRDEGDAALKAKDYATVVTKYGEYLKQNNYQDTARIFNCGYAANQAKNYAEAAKYFDILCARHVWLRSPYFLQSTWLPQFQSSDPGKLFPDKVLFYALKAL